MSPIGPSGTPAYSTPDLVDPLLLGEPLVHQVHADPEAQDEQ
jgi:hypothetical protein